MHSYRCGSRIFSWGRIFNTFLKILSTFFILGRSKRYSELSQSTKKTLFRPKLLRQRQKFEQKQAERVFLGTFWKNFTKNRFFAPPLKIVQRGKRGPFGSVGGRIPKWEASAHAPSPPLTRFALLYPAKKRMGQ